MPTDELKEIEIPDFDTVKEFELQGFGSGVLAFAVGILTGILGGILIGALLWL